MENKQTAVEWLEDIIKGSIQDKLVIAVLTPIFQQGKEMEKEQIIEAHDKARTYVLINVWKYDDGKQYYQETYENK
jgi:Mor family transcriptional regulator